MRLFVALRLPENVIQYLKTLQQNLPEAKMTLNKHFHLTLQFIGQVQPEELEPIKEKLSLVKFTKITLKLDKIGVYKNKKGYIKVVWAGLTFPPELKVLQETISDKLGELDYELDKPFSPHLTLARIKYADDKKFEKELEAIKISPMEFTLDTLVLYQSHLSKEGSRYDELLTIQAD
jgi:2'-5' RNA ligase